jgi:hypothetical protein
MTRYDNGKKAFWCPTCQKWIKWAAVIGRKLEAQETIDDYIDEYNKGGVDLDT